MNPEDEHRCCGFSPHQAPRLLAIDSDGRAGAGGRQTAYSDHASYAPPHYHCTLPTNLANSTPLIPRRTACAAGANAWQAARETPLVRRYKAPYAPVPPNGANKTPILWLRGDARRTSLTYYLAPHKRHGGRTPAVAHACCLLLPPLCLLTL